MRNFFLNRSFSGIPSTGMERIRLLLLVAMALTVATGTALAAVYAYKCPKCGLIQQYDHPGIFKCPKDGLVMIPAK